MPKTIRLAVGLVEALQLDDAGTCRSYGIEWSYRGREIEVTGSEAALRQLHKGCLAMRYASNPRYSRSATAAAARLHTFLENRTMTVSQIRVASTKSLLARRAEIANQAESIELDAIDEELGLREHDARDPSAGAAFGHLPS